MTSRQEHWDRVYSTNAREAVSWFQAEPAQSLELLRRAGLNAGTCVIDVGGGDSPLVDRLLDEGLTCLTVLDVSEVALSRAKARLGARQSLVRWIVADVTADWSASAVDIWHDRAVFHFLTEAPDRARYVAHVTRILKPGGSLVLATFALDGPEKCSGLPVIRYSADSLAHELGPSFRLVEGVTEAHRTPRGGTQSFCYSRFTYSPFLVT